MVKLIFQHEFSLSVHLQIMRGVFLMEAGDIMHQFYTSLFEQVMFLVSDYGCALSKHFLMILVNVLGIPYIIPQSIIHYYAFEDFVLIRHWCISF
jgi:hypothetical protein